MHSLMRLLQLYYRRIFAVAGVAFVTSTALVLGFLWRKDTPEYWIFRMRLLESQDAVPENEQYLTKGLAGVGPSAIKRILREVEERSPWDTSGRLSADALPLIGEEARQELYRRCSGETEPKKRIYFIYCLQDEFDDYSRLDVWLRDWRHSGWGQQMLEDQLQMRFGLTVPVADNAGKLNPQFLKWYQNKSFPHGPFPQWKGVARVE